MNAHATDEKFNPLRFPSPPRHSPATASLTTIIRRQPSNPDKRPRLFLERIPYHCENVLQLEKSGAWSGFEVRLGNSFPILSGTCLERQKYR
jgi:hypothetical protein